MEDAVPEELRAAALAVFRPLVISLTSSTPDMVAIPPLLQQLALSMPEELFVIDATDVSRDAQQKPTGKKARGATRPDGSPGSVSDTSKTVSQRLRELYVQHAVALEKGRRDAVAAHNAAIESLKAQYEEDGMSAAEALATATAEMADDDADSIDGADDDGELPAARQSYPFAADAAGRSTTPRASVVCLVNYPGRPEEVEELSAAMVDLHVLLDVRSPVPFGVMPRASVSGNAPEKRGTTTTARGSHSKVTTAVDSAGSESLPRLLQQHHEACARRPPDGSDALARVLLHTVDVPCEPIPGDAAGRLRATISEKALVDTIHETVLDLAAKLHSYRVWSASVCHATVPRYAPLANPDAVPDVAELEAEDTAKRAKTGSKKPATGSLGGGEEEAVVPVPQTTPAHPSDMSEVAANRTRFDASLSAHAADTQPVVARFVHACVHQAAGAAGAAGAERPMPLPTAAERDALRAAAETEATRRFLDNTWRTVDSAAAASAVPRTDAPDADTARDVPVPTLADALHAAVSPYCGARQAASLEDARQDETLEACLQRLLGECCTAKDITPAERQALVRDLLQCGLVTLSPEADLDVFSHILCSKNLQGWRVARGELDGAGTVYTLARELSTVARVQHGTYSFTGETTFPEYARLLDEWHHEHVTYFPPPLPSDAEDADDEEDAEEEEDEPSLIEDEDGNVVARPHRVPTPPPPKDHVRLITEALRRRRVLEALATFLHTPQHQSLLARGEGTLTASEEVAWVSLPDSLVEVERRVCNTRSVTVTATSVYGAEFGFLLEDPERDRPLVADDVVPPPHVRSGVRAFVNLGDALRLQTEVRADNTAAAEAATYAVAVEAAKKQAKLQFDAATAKLKTLKGKEKLSMQVQTLAEMEQEQLSRIPAPVRCRKELPELRVCVRLPQAVLQFDEARAAVCVVTSTGDASRSSALPSLTVLVPDRLNTNKARTTTLHGLDTVTYFAKGVVELRYASAPGLVVALHPDGSYVAYWPSDGTHSASCVTVSALGDCAVRSETETHALPLLASAPLIGRGSEVTSGYVRSDGLTVTLAVSAGGGGGEKRAHFADGVVATERWDGAYQWHVRGLPAVVCSASTATLTVEHDAGTLAFDTHKAALTLKSTAHGAVTANVDLVDYRVHVRTGDAESPSRTGPSSVVEIDAAFGGLVCGRVKGAASTSATQLCRVSALGTCTVESAPDGQLCVPAAYHCDGEPRAIRHTHREMACPAFVDALQSTDLRYPRDALQWQCPPLRALDEAAPRLPTVVCKTASEAGARDQRACALQHCLHVVSSANTPDAFCVVVGPTGSKLTFLSAACRSALLRRWLDRLAPLSLPPVPVPAGHGLLERGTQSAVAVRGSGGDGRGTDDGADLRWRLLVDSDGQPSSRWTAPCVHALVAASPQTQATLLDACTAALRARTAYAAEEPTQASPTPADTTAGVSSVPAGPPAAKQPTAQGRTTTQAPQEQVPAHRLCFWESDLAVRGAARMPVTSHGAARAAAASGAPPPADAYDAPPSVPTTEPAAGSSRHSPATATKSASARAADSYGGTPLMRACAAAATASDRARPAASLGATASPRGHHPAISVTPSHVAFGAVVAHRAYATLLYVTNTSTVPCRYRVAPAAKDKAFLSLAYPHRFLAAGMTDAVEVTLSGQQPMGAFTATLSLTHEGGSTTVAVQAETVAQAHQSRTLAAGVFCLGDALPVFVPGTTRRTTHNDDDDVGHAGTDDHSTSSDDDAAVRAS